MYKRQHYALEHSERNSASSGSSSSSLDTASDADSGGPEQVDDAAWPASSHESDESSQEEEVVEDESSTSVAERRAEAIRFAERKLAEAAEDLGEFGKGIGRVCEEAELLEKSGDEAVGSDAESSDESEDVPEPRSADQKNGICAHKDDSDEESSDVEPTEEVLAQRKVSNQWAEAVDGDEAERILDRFEVNTVICIGDEKKILKCRVCPKVLCLKEETMQAHIVSKRHARSMKQLAEGKLKIQLDSDGEEEEEGETHAERYARTMATAEELKVNARKRKRNSGRQRQRQRSREVLKKKADMKSETAVPVVEKKNRKERRAIVHGDSTEAKSATSTKTKGNVKDVNSSKIAEKKEANRKKRPRHT